MKLATSLAFLAAFAPWAVAQDTGTIEGVVINKVTGAGISNAIVQFLGVKATLYEAQTNETGTFRISAVKSGDYISSVEKSGYVSADNGRGYIDRPTHHVNSGGDPLRVRLELNPPAVIRGRVIGTDGNPARAEVDLGNGRTVNTDTEGSFAFDNLEPGPYTLLAHPKSIEPVSKQEGSRTEVVPTYYPSAVDPTQAEAIVVRAGAELSGYEIRLRSVPVYRVHGVVLNSDGTPAVHAVVALKARIGGENPDPFFFTPGGAKQSFVIQTARIELRNTQEPLVTDADGVFEFPSVPAGDWTVRAEGDPVQDALGGAIFSIGHEDPDDFKIQLAAPFQLSGVAVLNDGSAPASGVVLAVSLSSEIGRSGSGGIESGGVLRFDVMPGADRIHVDVTTGNYYADSILLGSTDVTTQRVELTPASPPIKIILKAAGTIRGTIEDADAGTVVLFPQSFTGIAYSTSTGAGKTFALDGIPPGDYYAIALDRFDPRTMADAVRLRSLMPMATSVKVEQGSAASVQLKVHHLAD